MCVPYFYGKNEYSPAEPYDDEPLTVSDSAIALADIPDKAPLLVHITNGANAIRYSFAGHADIADPTTTQGHYLAPNDDLHLNGLEAQRLKMIRVASDSTIYVTYYR